MNRLLPIAAVALGVTAAFALLVVAFTGWPPAVALAATTDSHVADTVMLGVDESTAVVIGPEVSIGEKFQAVTATLTVGATARAGLMSPAQKRHAKTVAPRKLKTFKTTREAAPAKKAVKAKSAKKAIKKAKPKVAGKWRKARVSWYGPGFYGNGMAGGGKLKRNSMVVAHRTLPFGTKVLIKYKGRTVTAVVKDRGPYIKGRTFDLGPGTAKALKFSGVGTIKYKIIKKKKK